MSNEIPYEQLKILNISELCTRAYFMKITTNHVINMLNTLTTSTCCIWIATFHIRYCGWDKKTSWGSRKISKLWINWTEKCTERSSSCPLIWITNMMGMLLLDSTPCPIVCSGWQTKKYFLQVEENDNKTYYRWKTLYASRIYAPWQTGRSRTRRRYDAGVSF